MGALFSLQEFFTSLRWRIQTAIWGGSLPEIKLQHPWLTNLLGRRRSPLHHQALRLVDIKPGVEFTIIFGNGRSETYTVIGYPELVIFSAGGITNGWWVEATDYDEGIDVWLMLGLYGIAPDFHPNTPKIDGFSPTNYALIDLP